MFTLCPSRHPWASIDCTEWAVSQGSSTPSPLESSHRENGAPVLCLVPWSRKVVGSDAIPMLAPDSGIWHHRRKKKKGSLGAPQRPEPTYFLVTTGRFFTTTQSRSTLV